MKVGRKWNPRWMWRRLETPKTYKELQALFPGMTLGSFWSMCKEAEKSEVIVIDRSHGKPYMISRK